MCTRHVRKPLHLPKNKIQAGPVLVEEVRFRANISDSHGQVLALALRQKSLKPFKMLHLGSEADLEAYDTLVVVRASALLDRLTRRGSSRLVSCEVRGLRDL